MWGVVVVVTDPFSQNIPFMATSAHDGKNLEEVFMTLAAEIKKRVDSQQSLAAVEANASAPELQVCRVLVCML